MDFFTNALARMVVTMRAYFGLTKRERDLAMVNAWLFRRVGGSPEVLNKGLLAVIKHEAPNDGRCLLITKHYVRKDDGGVVLIVASLPVDEYPITVPPEKHIIDFLSKE